MDDCHRFDVTNVTGSLTPAEKSEIDGKNGKTDFGYGDLNEVGLEHLAALDYFALREGWTAQQIVLLSKL